MENNRWNLIMFVLDIFAGICFVIAAVKQTDSTSKILMCISAVLFLTSGIGMLWTCVKNNKKSK